MAHEFERPRITEIHVRMDCNGCVQKIKKAVNGIKGIYDFYIDVPQQKLTIIGKADPERIMKAIKKVRKVATLCSHTEAPDPNCQPIQPPSDAGAPPPDGGAPGQEVGQCQPLEQPQAQEAYPPPPPEPPTDQPPPPYQPENPPCQGQQPEPNPPLGQADMQPIPPPQTQIPNHVVPPEYGRSYGNGYGQGDGYGQSFRHEPPSQHVYHTPQHDSGYYERPRHNYHESLNVSGYHQQYQPVHNNPQPQSIYHHSPSQPPYHDPPPPNAYHEPPRPPGGHYSEPPPQTVAYHEPPPQAIHHEQPVYATHNYNMYRPAPSITEYHYVQSPPRYTSNNRTNYSNMDSYEYSNISDRNVSSVFSDENPNACTIV